ncbi:phage major tail protein%2C TP901-1 family [Chlamydia trachomatis]|nr:phage major tail protein%2C TP901-1 family [Chlamydia trachomatis]
MADAVQGVKKVLLWRSLKDAAKGAGAKIALQTEHETTSSRDVKSQQTKDGVIRTLGQVEQEIKAKTYLSTTDEVEKLEAAHEDGEIIEVWDVQIDKPTSDSKYKATYYQAYIGEISKSAPTDDGIEVSLTFNVIGVGKRGKTALSKNQQEVVDYLFVEATEGTTQEKARQTLSEL